MYSEGQIIHYYIQEKQPDSKFNEIAYPDKLDKRIEVAVAKQFPFSKNSKGRTMQCPNWTRSLLYKYNILYEVEKMIKYFNMGGEAIKEKDHAHDQKLSYLLIQDVFL